MGIRAYVLSRFHRKLLAEFLLLGIVPYAVALLYFGQWGRDTIVERELQTYRLQAIQAGRLMEYHLKQLQQEVAFLAQLELFDDMLSYDIDRRISRLLEQKSHAITPQTLTLDAIDANAKVIASSIPSHIDTQALKLPLNHLKQRSRSLRIEHDTVVFSVPLHSSFDQRFMGYLIATYPLENLKLFVAASSGLRYRLANEEHVLMQGGDDKVAEGIEVHTRLHGVLEGFVLSYYLSDAQLFAFINRFLLYMTLLLVAGSALIIYAGRRLSKEMTAPIQLLSHTAKQIITTQNYGLRVCIETSDETGELAWIFNQLIATTQNAFERIAAENQLRMKRFLDLTELFNQITQIKEHRACIDILLEKLASIVPFRLAFSTCLDDTTTQTLALPLQLQRSDGATTAPYGYLLIEKPSFDDALEERFFRSVAAMIALQLERIGLLETIRNASEAKSVFISNMSHELRTPLSAIIGFAQYMMAYESLEESQIDTIAKMERAALHSLSLINDILDISKIEAGKIQMQIETVELCTLLRESMEMIDPLAQDQGLYVREGSGMQIEVCIQSDHKLLKQVVINLLSNALKFTPSGGIEVNIKADTDMVEILIQDSGIGIEAEDLTRVFDEFTQLPNPQQSQHKGSGLGLSLSRKIVERLGGELLLQSEGKGKGSTAVIRLKVTSV